MTRPEEVLEAVGRTVSRLLRREKPEARVPVTHDYTRRMWGHDYGFTTKDKGQTLDAHGWGPRGSYLSVGDFLLIQNGDRTTRYMVEAVRYCPDPRDMWFATLRFAPRTESEARNA